jgi:hypothetical protein
MTQRTGLCCVVLLAFIGCRDRKLTDDLEWMDNIYNLHSGVSGGYGHRRSAWYVPSKKPDTDNPFDNGVDKLSEGSTDSFKNDGCDFEFHADINPAGSVNSEIFSSMVFSQSS